MTFKGHHHSEKSRKKISNSLKGKQVGSKNGMFGKHHTESARKKISEATKGENNPFYGKRHSEESLKKIGDSSRGRKHSEEDKAKMKFHKGKPHGWIGRHHSDESKEKMSNSRSGSKAYRWKGGISFEPYCFKFNEKRKRSVRKFFNNLCIVCGKHESENITKTKRQIKLSIHHIDHDKKQGCNGKPFNLVPLCLSCHSKEQIYKDDYKNYINKTLDEGFKWGIWSRDQYVIEVMYTEEPTNKKGDL